MRKIFLAVAAMAMLATACTKDDSAVVGNESLVSFSVSSPELATRYGEGSEATDLYYAFYEVKNDGTLSILSDLSATTEEKAETLVGGKATINVSLVDGRNYAAIFWAQAEGAPYTIDWESQTMSYANATLTVNNEDYDAFYAYYPVSTEKTHKVSLTRPFAQINIATAEEDYNNAVKAGLTATQTKVVVKGVCTSFDLVNGKVAADEQSELTFDWAAIAECDEANCTGKKAGYKNLAMNYVLVEGRRLVTVEMYVNDSEVKRTYTTVPVERNYRTYILGKLLTTSNEFNVEVEEDFNDTTLPETEVEKLIMKMQTEGGEFTLPGNIELKGTLELRHDVVLDLNGYTISAALKQEGRHHYAIDNYAALTLKGEGNIEARGIENFGTMTVDGNITITNVDTNGGAAIWNEGNLVINGGTFQTNANAGDDSYGAALNTRENGTAVVNGGNFIAYSQLTYAIINAGETVINNATVKGKHGAVAGDGSKATVINGGSFELMPNPNVSDHCAYYVSEIKGGTFTLGANTDSGAQVFYNSQIAEGFAAYDNGDETYTVLPALTAALKDVTTDTVVDVATDMHVATGTTPHTHNATADITINGNGNSVISTAESADDFQWEGGTIPAMSTIFSSANGSKVTVNDLTFEGTMSALMLGHYKNSTYNNYNTELNNVNVIDTEVVSFSSNVSPAVCVYGTAVLNNCNIYGTTLSELDTDPMWPVYDLALVNYTNTTLNDCNIGSIIFWNQAALIVNDGTVIEELVVLGNMNNNNANNYININAGAEVKVIDLSKITDKNRVKINIEAGATVGKVVANGVEYSTLNSYLNMDAANTEVAADADDLVGALENGKDVILDDDVNINPAGMSNAYGTTGINVKNGQTIDGGGHTLDIQGAGGTWDSGINTTGGLITNIKITGSFRGIFINHNSTHSEPVVLENVILDGTVYTISCDQGLNQTLKATNSTFKGWTSYAATLGSATFTDCYFGEGRGYAFCRPYAPTVFEGCEFEAGFTVDPVANVTFKNCTLNGVLLTSANITELVTNAANVTVENN